MIKTSNFTDLSKFTPLPFSHRQLLRRIGRGGLRDDMLTESDRPIIQKLIARNSIKAVVGCWSGNIYYEINTILSWEVPSDLVTS